ncbi:flavodoxin [Sphingobacterium sp. ML3W]|uniref:flavodoxin family protein n=1 Tax=Sphingobacterium sp. ML3W TaxID=1538644 RepID=UPI0004F858F7|nr:flavodoxin [Sphingobacterium sp. ML3W]AIM36702.1 flavodoxin [Sphingobacterium sp. ML3W]
MKIIQNYSPWIGVIFLMLTSCSRASELPVGKTELINDMKVLIVYLSRTKNTKAIAEMINQKINSDLIELELQTLYPADYKTTIDQVASENARDFLPPLKTKIDSIEKYDIIFIGFPTWGMRLPPPMKGFLNQYDLSGKTVIPFNTNAGYGMGSSFETVKQLCPDSQVLEGFSTKGGKERDGVLYVMEGNREFQVQEEIQNWLIRIGMIK